MQLGSQLKYHRERLGETQVSLASKLGVTRQSVSKWENDLCFPDLKTLVTLSELYGITLDVLVHGTGFFLLPFEIGKLYTRKQLIKHISLFTLFVSIVCLVTPTFIFAYWYYFSAFLLIGLFLFPFVIPKYWCMNKDGFLLNHKTYLNQFISFFIILTKGSNLPVYQFIAWHEIESVLIDTDITIKTMQHTYHVPIGHKNKQNIAYLHMPEMVEWLISNGVHVDDPQQLISLIQSGNHLI